MDIGSAGDFGHVVQDARVAPLDELSVAEVEEEFSVFRIVVLNHFRLASVDCLAGTHCFVFFPQQRHALIFGHAQAQFLGAGF